MVSLLWRVLLAFRPLKVLPPYEGQSYSDKDLANLLNDKFIAVCSSLPSLVWSPLTVDEFPTDFYISINDIAEALLSSKLDPFICWPR